jgi:hypothetical protein
MEQNKPKQTIYMRDRVDLKDLEHDYQRMRKLAKKRRNGILTRFNKEQARVEKEIQRKLGGEAWVNLKQINLIEASVWLSVGLLVGFWLGGR